MSARTGGPVIAGPSRRLVLLIGLAISAWLLFFPAKQLATERLRVMRIEHRLAAVSAQNRRLEAEVKRLGDPSELELQARERLGWVRQGESAYLVVPRPTPPEARPSVGGARREAVWSRIWTAVRQFVSGDR